MTDEQLPYETLRENSILLFEALEHSMTEPEGVRLRLPKRDRKARRIQPARTALLFGYAAHVLGLTGTVIELLDKNRVLEATPIVRSGYETALQSQWLDETRRKSPRSKGSCLTEKSPRNTSAGQQGTPTMGSWSIRTFR